MNDLIKLAEEQGFPYTDSIIHIFAGGSEQHGAKLSAKSDIDICGVYIPPVEQVAGILEDKHFVSSTGEKDERNKPGDVDIAMYSLQKWARLACKGNPTVLSYIFMPTAVEGVWGKVIAPNRKLFLASSHANAFIGYGRSQLQRINGERGSGKHGQRDPLIDKWGFDLKAAMHMMRMMYECKELLTEGTMTFPRPEVETLLEIRRGEWSKSQVEREYLILEEEINSLRDGSLLPITVDRDTISKVVTDACLMHWKF